VKITRRLFLDHSNKRLFFAVKTLPNHNEKGKKNNLNLFGKKKSEHLFVFFL